MLEFDSGDYEAICIFAKKREKPETGKPEAESPEAADLHRSGWICLTSPGGGEQEVHLGRDEYRQIWLALPEKGRYRLQWEGVVIAQMYLSGCEDLLEKGVGFLHTDSGKAVELGSWYDTPAREQYHFGPFVNWINDPNGLCWYEGYYHLFYQANPFGQEWNDMYWGHAASRDLIHWVHLPHCLQPQPELCRDRGRKGGAFSGSAVVETDGIHLYLTRHDGPQEDGAATREWQTEAFCRDGIHIEGETAVITEKPEGVSFDFRDPKAARLDGEDYLVLGAALNQTPAILLYHRKAGEWQYLGPLLCEREPGVRTFECPDFFKLDGTYVAAGAWMCHRDEANRYQMTRCYLGEFDGRELKVQKEQWFDFGSNYYAVQTFEHDQRRIAIGWISDFYGEHRAEAEGALGSFALPRQLRIEDGRLFMEPVAECYGLLKDLVWPTEDEGWSGERKITGNSFFVRVKLRGDGDFKITVAQEGDDSLSLERKNGETALVSTRKEVDQVRFPSDVRQVRFIEIFVDRRVTEVYLNHGEAAGTKLFYREGKDGYLKAEISPEDLESIEAWTMKSIWS